MSREATHSHTQGRACLPQDNCSYRVCTVEPIRPARGCFIETFHVYKLVTAQIPEHRDHAPLSPDLTCSIILFPIVLEVPVEH